MPSKNKVPPCPTPAIDAAVARYRFRLVVEGYTPEEVRAIEAGEEWVAPRGWHLPAWFMGKRVVATEEKPCPT